VLPATAASGINIESMYWKIPKTVLGNKIEWDLAKIPGRPKKGRWTGKDDQLWRCRKTKKFEASLLNNLPHGASFVDAGAHFGDTVLTMALYARDTLRRDDIRFVAFEPNPKKARFIEECAAANGFAPDTLRVISCVLGDETSIEGATAMRDHGKDWCEFDGRTSYSKVTPPDEDVSSVPSGNRSCSNIDDEYSCGSNSTSSCNRLLDVHRLDDYYDQIHPLGFLHIDVEGWEARVIAGASSLLTASENSTAVISQCYVLAETFSKKEARSRGPGFSETHEDDVLKVMREFSFTRGEDVVDIERNLFFARFDYRVSNSVSAVAAS
jgi:FkbM family methyltransferase